MLGLALHTYGCEVNYTFLDILNDFGLEQLVNSPTRNSNTLDLVLATEPNLLSEIQIVPGISDYKAVLFQFNQLHNKGQTYYRKIIKQILKAYI